MFKQILALSFIVLSFQNIVSPPSPLLGDGDPLTCMAMCNGDVKNVLCGFCTTVDSGICQAANYVLCVGGCLDIPPCKDACYNSIVQPCVDSLVNDCYDGCTGVCASDCLGSVNQTCNDSYGSLTDADYALPQDQFCTKVLNSCLTYEAADPSKKSTCFIFKGKCSKATFNFSGSTSDKLKQLCSVVMPSS